MDQLAAVIARLESATTRLENLSKSVGPSSTVSNTLTTSGAVTAFEDFVASHWAPIVKSSETIGGLVKDQVTLVSQALEAQKHIIQTASASKKPDGAALQDVIKPLQTLLGKITEIKDKNRPSPLYFHLSAIADGIPALGWVVVEPTPGPYVAEMKEAAQFYANRVIKDNKEKDKIHVEWAQGYLAFLTELQAYVKKFHTTGLVWNAKGGDAKSFSSTASTSSAPTPAPAPTPTSTPAQGSSTPVVSLAPKPDISSALAGALTSGLRKVDKSEMTHKNPELRASSIVSAAAPSVEKPTPKFGGAAPKAPPKLELQGKKWAVENYVNNPEIVVTVTDLSQVVYIYNCQNSTIKVIGKVNAVSIDNCKKVGILLESVLSSVDFVNCKSVQGQITGKVPTIAIDKTDGIQLYLSKEALAVEIFTAKSSELNISIPDESGSDYIEKPLPEQFKTVIKNGAIFTEAVEHSG